MNSMNLSLRIDEAEIKLTKSARFLGMEFDSGLKWGLQLGLLKAKLLQESIY